MKNGWRNYLPIFLPLLWMPVVIGGLAVFLPRPLSPLSSAWPVAHGLSYVLEGAVFLGITFSLYGCWSMRDRNKYWVALIYLLFLPVQVVAIFLAEMAVFGK